jgi:hypothetical protein
VADTYGLLTDLDAAAPFVDAVEAAGTIRIAYIVTDDDRRFQSVAQRLPDGVEAVRLYESYLDQLPLCDGALRHEIHAQRLSGRSGIRRPGPAQEGPQTLA